MINRNINIMPIAGNGFSLKSGYKFLNLNKVKNTYIFVKASKSFEKKINGFLY